MKKILYFDCFAGISGDMAVGALIDLGVDFSYLQNELSKIHLHGYSVKAEKVIKNGIASTKFSVVMDDHSHSHEADADKHDDHDHHSRNLADIIGIINSSTLNENVKSLSGKIFHVIGEAEAHVHGKDISEIHFHEVGAVDSIVDIVSFAICFDKLAVDEVVTSPVNTGGGFVKCAHGIFPVPAPAVVKILETVPVYSAHAEKELTTPTGAAIVKAVSSKFERMDMMQIESTGYGAGTRDLEIPNVLRAIICSSESSNRIILIEANIDDMNTEIYPYLFEKLFAAGAVDVFLVPVLMKKGRPGNILSVMVSSDKQKDVKEIIFSETTTFGLRSRVLDRDELEREFIDVDLGYDTVRGKKGSLSGKLLKISPEYEGCCRAAEKSGKSVNQVYNDFAAAASKIYNTEK